MGSGGIATSEGATWKFQRKLTSQIYSTKAFHEYTSDVFVEQAKKVVDHLGTAADQGEVIDFQSLFIKYTLGCLGAIAFGNDFGCLDNIKDEIPFVASYGYLLALCSKRMFNPVWKIHERWTGVSEKVKHHRELLRGCALEIIQKRRKENCSVHKKDLLQLLLESSDDSGSPLSDDLLAGHESTASTMTWMIYSIYKDGTDYHIAAALVQEIDDVLRGLDPTYQTHKKQKFAEACGTPIPCAPAQPENLRPGRHFAGWYKSIRWRIS
ncbi:Protein kinase alk2 [Linnemannia zychae]|nr:Protein kinase alk2 [Linnemannia zychae]